VGPGPIGSFDWSQGEPVGPYQAGGPIDASVRAIDRYGNFDSDYTGHSDVFSGLSPSPDGTKPSYPAFTSGSASGFTDFDAESNVAITATDSSDPEHVATGTSNTFSVGPAPATHFRIPTPATQTAGHSFDVPMTALDPWANIDTNYGTSGDGGTNGTVSVTFSGPTDPAPDGQSHPTYPGTVAFAGGQATATITLVTAEDTLLKELGGNGVTGETPSKFTVLPGELDHFTVGGPSALSDPPVPARAGYDSTAKVTAFDAFGNVKTNYVPAAGQPHLTGDLSNSTTGCGTGNASPCSPIYSGVGAFATTGAAAGTATATFRPFDAESGRHITVTDTALGKSGTSDAFVVSPGDLDHFVVGAPAPAPRAGYTSTVAVTAWDAYGNLKTDYSGSPTLKGNLSTSATGCSGPCAPAYGPVAAFSGGNSSATFKPFVATEPGPPVTPTSEANRHVTVTDTTLNKSGTSADFSVVPGDPKTLAFVKQPTETCAAKPNTLVCASDNTQTAIINDGAGVKVSATDGFGNAAYNTTVHVGLGLNPGNATLNGTLNQGTDANGIATFNNLTINNVALGYSLSATAPPTSPTAGPTSSFLFNITQTVNTCTSTCSGTATDQPSSILSVSGSGTFLTGNTLGVALTQAAPSIPANACPTFGVAPSYSASYANVNQVQTTGPQPSLTITWTIPKAVVQKIPNIPQNNNNGASHYDICLGTINLQHPFDSTLTGWPTKNGGTALPSPDPTSPDPTHPFIIYWGIIPDCPKNPTTPCMLKRNKDTVGNLILTYFVPFPYDPTGWAGGGI
jgi:hypothetical protein